MLCTSRAASFTSAPRITAIGMMAMTMQTSMVSAAARVDPMPKRRSKTTCSGWKMIARITAQKTAP